MRPEWRVGGFAMKSVALITEADEPMSAISFFYTAICLKSAQEFALKC